MLVKTRTNETINMGLVTKVWIQYGEKLAKGGKQASASVMARLSTGGVVTLISLGKGLEHESIHRLYNLVITNWSRGESLLDLNDELLERRI